MKRVTKFFMAAFLAGMFSVSFGQNIIIQQNNGSNTTTSEVSTSNPKPSLGIGILQLVNERRSYWCNCESYRIVGLFIKKRGETNYNSTNYCEDLGNESTNIPFDEGVYDLKIKYKSNDCYYYNSENVWTYYPPEYEYVECKNVMIKRDFITKVLSTSRGVRCEIPTPM